MVRKTPYYEFNADEFIENYKCLEGTFRHIYPDYHIAYSFKTNYTPAVCKIVLDLGGYAEVVSDMEYELAKRIGFSCDHIIYNGPGKESHFEECVLNNGILNIDNFSEIDRVCQLAQISGDLSVGIRVNFDIGNNLHSRFGIDAFNGDLENAISRLQSSGVRVKGLHFHISRARGLSAWERRITTIVELADKVESIQDAELEYLDIGSGMFGDLGVVLRDQFGDIPSYAEYAEIVAGAMAEHYKGRDNKPLLFTEPGTTVVSKYFSLYSKVLDIKTIRNKTFALLDCSFHNVGEICGLKKVPMRIVIDGGQQEEYQSVDLVGYTCLEQDIIYHSYQGRIGKGDTIVFDNVGGYSIVDKPPFIHPDIPIYMIRDERESCIKRAQTIDDIFAPYVFEKHHLLKPLTVLLTASGSQFAPGIIKCLKNNGERDIRVIGADMSDDPSNKFFVDKFHCVPATNSDNFVDAILDICNEEKVDILLPQMSAELPVYLENLQRFKEIQTIVSMTTNSNLNIANNKIKLFDFMKSQGIPTPDYVRVASLTEFEKGLISLGYPSRAVVVKIPESSGARGIRVIDENKSKYETFVHAKPSSVFITREDMLSIIEDTVNCRIDSFPELMLMEYLPCDEYDIDILADNGKVLYSAGRRNPEMVMSITQTSVLERDDRAEMIACQLVEALRLDGNLGFDFKYDANGKAQLLEINPRIDATVSIFAAGGLNLPYLRIKQLLGEQLPEVCVKYGTRLKRRYLETFTDIDGNLIDW